MSKGRILHEELNIFLSKLIWSVGVSVGVFYCLSNSLNIYLEPSPHETQEILAKVISIRSRMHNNSPNIPLYTPESSPY